MSEALRGRELLGPLESTLHAARDIASVARRVAWRGVAFETRLELHKGGGDPRAGVDNRRCCSTLLTEPRSTPSWRLSGGDKDRRAKMGRRRRAERTRTWIT